MSVIPPPVSPHAAPHVGHAAAMEQLQPLHSVSRIKREWIDVFSRDELPGLHR